ncbi:MAG: putative quinol monooxygenase [Pseudomonadota bacterium]
MIIVLGSIIAKSGEEDAVKALSLEHVQRSRTEAGCIAHNVSIDCENPSRFVFVEEWADMPALMAHFQLEASQHFVRDLRAHLAEPPVMKMFDADEVSPS